MHLMPQSRAIPSNFIKIADIQQNKDKDYVATSLCETFYDIQPYSRAHRQTRNIATVQTYLHTQCVNQHLQFSSQAVTSTVGLHHILDNLANSNSYTSYLPVNQAHQLLLHYASPIIGKQLKYNKKQHNITVLSY